jgi:hypothetical protein
MSSSTRVRLLALVWAAVFLALALAIRAAFDGPLEQHSGTALYASMVYAGMYLVWPRVSPLVAGAGAIAFCWAVECAQLTGVPAYLSERSLLARLALGMRFDPLDLVWYPAGVIPLVAVHWLLRDRHGRRPEQAR